MMYEQSSKEEMSDETRDIFMEMICNWVLSLGVTWTCTNGLEGHSGWGGTEHLQPLRDTVLELGESGFPN